MSGLYGKDVTLETLRVSRDELEMVCIKVGNIASNEFEIAPDALTEYRNAIYAALQKYPAALESVYKEYK